MNIFNKKILIATFVVSSIFGLTSPEGVSAAGPATVNLGSSANFLILSKTGITTTGVTTISGDIGVSPAFATTMTGFGLVLDGSGTFSTSALVTGRVYAADYAISTPATLTAAVSAMEAAYTEALSRPVDVTDAGAGNLAGLTLVPSTYFFSGPGNVTITGDVTLSGGANDIWIFQIPGTLNLSGGMRILLTGGAVASNIFWAVAGTTTIEPGAIFEGNILGGPGASTIAMQNSSVLHGRALGQTNVTLIGSSISLPVVAPTPTPTPTPVVVVAQTGSRSGGRSGNTSVSSNVSSPIINITKIASRSTPFPQNGGSVVYLYEVTNLGSVAMQNVAVSDEKCSPLFGPFGDTDTDNMLDTNEAWAYSCATYVSVSTNSVASAHGTANGSTVSSYAYAPVFVGTPSLPNAGFFSGEAELPWGQMMIAGVIALLIVSLGIVFKRRSVILSNK